MRATKGPMANRPVRVTALLRCGECDKVVLSNWPAATELALLECPGCGEIGLMDLAAPPS
jgi:hypothetical protein